MNKERLKLHADIVDRMATARGVDLEEAAIRGHISVDDISDLVLRCAGCTQVTACQTWLQQQAGAVSHTPHYCRNSHAFRALALGSS